MKGLTRRIARHGPAAALLALFAGLFLYPIVRLLLLPWFPALGPAGAQAGAPAGTQLGAAAIYNTVWLGLASTLVAVPAGLSFGWLLERRRWRGNGLLTLILWLVFLTPSYLLTTGWQILFSLPTMHGGILGRWFFSRVGIVVLLGLKGLPFATLAARSSWAVIGSELEDAARILGLPAWRRRGVLLRLLLPAAGSAFAVVFVESIQEFGIPATLGAQIHLPIVTYAIYERLATTPVAFAQAAQLSWALVGLAALAAGVHMYLSGRHGGALVHGRSRTVPVVPCGATAGYLAGAALVLLTAFGLVMPAVALVHAALRPDPAAVIIPVQWSSLLYSSLYAGTGALLAVAVAMPVVAGQRRAGHRTGHLLEIISLGNMAIPGLVLGAAYIIAFNSRLLPLYGTPLLLVIAYVAAQVPMLMRFLQGPLTQLHANLSDAARLHGLPWLQRATDIHGPLLLSPFLWGWTMAFGQIFFELPISELLYPAGRAPVGVAMVALNQRLLYGDEARLALAGIVLALVIAGLLTLALRAAGPVPQLEETLP